MFGWTVLTYRASAAAKALKRDAIPSVVDAVKRGEVPIAQAASFAKATPPLDQARLIAEHGSPAAAVNASKPDVKAKADRAAVKTPRPVPDVTPAAARAEQAAAAKLPTSAKLIDLIEHFGRINISGTIARMSNDDRITLLTQIVRANECLNNAAVAIAVSGGANLGVLAPVSRRFEALEFLHAATARIEAELADWAVRESAS